MHSLTILIAPDTKPAWIALSACLFLIVAHYLSPIILKRLPKHGLFFSSFAGGTAVAYVFLHMLPSLVEYNKPISTLLETADWLTPFTELLIYIVALLGFLIYYGLDIAAEYFQVKRHNRSFVYALHLGMFCLYNFLITYTMSLRVLVSIYASILFTSSMALHFVLTDRKFARLYQHRFNHKGRFVLIFALFVGWLCSVLFEPINVLLAAFMVAFLSGSVLLTVFREELPAKGMSNYIGFSCGALCIAGLLLGQIWLGKFEKSRTPSTKQQTAATIGEQALQQTSDHRQFSLRPYSTLAVDTLRTPEPG